MDLIADTNLWYDLAAGRRSRTDADLQGNLLATPISFIEITGKLIPASLLARQGAAKAILDHSSGIAQDPETYLSVRWGLGDPAFGIDWNSGLIAIIDAKSLHEIVSGVADRAAGVTRSVNTQAAHAARLAHWEGFAEAVEDMIESELPGYKATRAIGGKLKQFRGAGRTAFEQKVRSVAMRDELIAATHARACLVNNKPAVWPAASLLQMMTPVFERYARVYAEYIIRCATGMAPQPNDWGDLEHFIYLDGSNAMITNDKRWRMIAIASGMSSDIR
jgi:hypothetical protein